MCAHEEARRQGPLGSFLIALWGDSYPLLMVVCLGLWVSFARHHTAYVTVPAALL